MIPMEIKTLVVIQPPNPSFVVLQPINAEHTNGKVVPIWIGHTEALYLGMALEQRRFSRPMTHDLLMDVLANLDGSIERIDITEVQGSTFYADISLKQYDRVLTVDARPSDALALAVRQSAPIYVSEEVVNHVGCYLQLQAKEDDIDASKELEQFHDFLNDLTPDDFS